jgi:hypothetical protein
MLRHGISSIAAAAKRVGVIVHPRSAESDSDGWDFDTEPGRCLTITVGHITQIELALSSDEEFDDVQRGREVLARLNPHWMGTDPQLHCLRLGALAEYVFNNDPQECQQVKSVMRCYLRLRKQFNPADDFVGSDLFD